LVDFINAFCIRSKDYNVIDPTCGSGTFLLRAYDRLNFFGQRNHGELLNQLWGVDIAHFPAELATINLYRQNLADVANFPRIVRKDFFEVKAGDIFDFPAPEPETDLLVSEKLPVFDAAVGNFPYIRQELIERSVKGYKQNLERVLAEDWLNDYPEFFEKGGIPRLSGQADIYAYLFFHTVRFIREGGRMGFITSNAWLDVAYGYELQKFFLKNFKIIAILESRYEPWFEQSAVNTVVTILERCSDKEERDQHLVKFVKVKRKLRELIPRDMKLDAMNRWSGIDRLVAKIENAGGEYWQIIGDKSVNILKGHKTYEDMDFRIRVKRQVELLNELEKAGKMVKWGVYLRAPEVYFEILEKCKDKLVPLNNRTKIIGGIITGDNNFFYLSKEKLSHHEIEDEFLVDVVKTPREIKTISFSSKGTKYKLLNVQLPKSELYGKKVKRYIEEGENRKIDGKSSFKDKETWYRLRIKRAPLLWPDLRNDIHICHINKDLIPFEHNFYGIIPIKKEDEEILCSFLNSSILWNFLEVEGRVALGEGAIRLVKEDLEKIPIIAPDLICEPGKQEIIQAFSNLLKRPIKSIFEEVKMADRQKLDSLILEAIGLDSNKYLQPLYEGLTQLVRERLELGRMRGRIKKAKSERNLERIKEQVIAELLPNGVKKFPEDFREPSKAGFFELDIPTEPLKLEPPFFGKQKVISDSGWCHEAKSPAEAKFIIYAQAGGHTRVAIPKDGVVLLKMVSNYERYLKELKENLFNAFSIRIFDYKQAQALTGIVFKELGLPESVEKE